MSSSSRSAQIIPQVLWFKFRLGPLLEHIHHANQLPKARHRRNRCLLRPLNHLAACTKSIARHVGR